LVAAYADLSVPIVLQAYSAAQVPRELLDELGREAALTLGAAGLVPGGGASNLAIKAMAGATLVIVRSATDPTDALICKCGDGIALEGFLSDAMDVAGADE
jgi:hypothetical protein